MLKVLSGVLLVTASLVQAASAGAEPAANRKAAPSTAVSTKAAASQTAEAKATAGEPGTASVKRDPHGVKGISPFMEAVHKGDSAFVARDFDGAIAAYRDAITKEPENAFGHYRMGEAQLAKGDLHEAEEAYLNGLRFVSGVNLNLKAKLQLVLADLRERQKSYDDAVAKWTEYEASATQQKEPPGFPATATERKKVIDVWVKLSADSAAVKARIQKGVQAADEAVRKSSK